VQRVVTLKPTAIFEGEENGFKTELRALPTYKWKLNGKTPYPTVGYRNFDKKITLIQSWLGMGANVLSNF
jgi:hypothetical protein